MVTKFYKTSRSMLGTGLLLGAVACGGIKLEPTDDGAGGTSAGAPDTHPYVEPCGGPKELPCAPDAGGTPSTGGTDSGGTDSGGTISVGVGGTDGWSIGGEGGEIGGTTSGGTDPVGTQYPGSGFVVHEWGTDTIVVGSDGSLQRGLHHEEEDLPDFVYDRLKAAPDMPQNGTSVTIKMETPVTYFYSEKPLQVQASVGFPKGVLTQWYPNVVSFAPWVAAAGSVMMPDIPASYADPYLDFGFPFQTQICRDLYATLHNGNLDWGTINVLDRGESPAMPSAPLEKYSWSYARQVASNPIKTAGGQAEQFLFYRGLGEFDLPVKVSATGKGAVELANTYPEAIGRVFVVNVDGQHGAFNEHKAGIPAGKTLTDTAPSLDGAPSVAQYTQALGARVTAALDATGLYHDEAVAMVNTWKHQWFGTPGTRLLYLIPQSWTDTSIPLTIAPKPSKTLRVMLIRVEVITPELEAKDLVALKEVESDPPAGKAYFAALGRFAEPRLRRAVALSPSAAGDKLLEQIQVSKGSVSMGE